MVFTNSNDVRVLWEERILPGWRHRDRHIGQRFLGSLNIRQETSNRLLSIVGRNLRSHLSSGGNLTYESLRSRFDISQNWVRIVTAALSEYAYYYSSSNQGFWEGFCKNDLIQISHSPGVEIAFRQIVRVGIELLGLVRASQGHKFVSTLWLQSGIPQRNLHHFSELVQEIAKEYGWWELAHTSERLLSQELLEFCQERHSQWGILINFLQASCSETEDGESISGQLIQGIAIVALELERNNDSPDILSDPNAREHILRNYYLPGHFFLRNWDNLIQVLTQTRQSGGSYFRTIRPRNKPLLMVLDVFDTGNIQLLLPEQNLRNPNWDAYRGQYCQIPMPTWSYSIPTSPLSSREIREGDIPDSEEIWEGDIPNSDFLEIPELAVNIRQADPRWSLRLLSHNNRELFSWNYEGITDALPCLVFDANLGTHISLETANPVISKTNEIIFFIPRDVKLELNNEIDILSSYFPCSISGWYGQHIQLRGHNSKIILVTSRQSHPIRITWQISDSQHPVLRGLKIKGRKEVYIETPTLWHPPTSQSLNFNTSVKNLTNREIISENDMPVPVSDHWQSISIEHLITSIGNYQVRLWNNDQRYSFDFELIPQHLISGVSDLENLQILRKQGEIVRNLPIQCDRLEQFWAETVAIQGLWTFEKVTLILSNGNDEITYLVHADKAGSVVISLATLYGKLDRYTLDYQRSGMAAQRLVELVSEVSPQTSSSETEIQESESIQVAPTSPANPPEIIAINGQLLGEWHLVHTRPHGREVFYAYLQGIPHEIGDLILQIELPQVSPYRNQVLLRLIRYRRVCNYIHSHDCFRRIESEPLTIAQVNQILGRN